MEGYMKNNQERWNELVAIHAASSNYDLEGFMECEGTVHNRVRLEPYL